MAITDVEVVDAAIADNVRGAAGAAECALRLRIGEKTTVDELAADQRVSNNQAPPHRIGSEWR